MDATTAKLDLATRAAILYYKEDKNQNEVAKALGISRSYVSQLLSLAKEAGIVKITINARDSFNKEQEFRESFGIRQVYIMETDSSEETAAGFGAFCAPETIRLFKNATDIGINMGASVRKAIEAVEKDDLGEHHVKSVVQIMGSSALNKAAGALPTDLVARTGQLLGCNTVYLNAPGLLESETTKELLLKEPGIKQAMKAWEHLDLALLGIGVAGKGEFFEQSETFVNLINGTGAVADINLNLLSENGEEIHALDPHRMSMPIEALRNVTTKCAYAYGVEKAAAIRAAIKAGLVDVLFTDSITAEKILEMETAPTADNN